MLCAKYDYKMDIAVKQEEAFEDGMEQKAVEAAITLVKEFNIAPEDAAVKIGAPLTKVLEALSKDNPEGKALYDNYGYKLETSVKQEEAFEDGMEQKAVNTAINLIKMNLGSYEQIAEATGLPIKKISELAKDLDKTCGKTPGKNPSVFP
jgi:hypothetical protein